MQITLQNGSLWAPEFKTKKLVDITHEAERYLQHGTLNLDNAIVADFISVLQKNPALRSMFAGSKTAIYENVVFSDPREEKVLLSKSTLEKYIYFCEGRTHEAVCSHITDKSKSDYIAIITEHYKNEISHDVGSFNEITEFSLSLANIKDIYLKPIRYVTTIRQEDKFEIKKNTPKEMKLLFAFTLLASNLNEMIFSLKDEMNLSERVECSYE